MDNELNPGLSIIHANRLEDLRELVARWTVSHPLRPLEPELFIVQSNGMAQWLKLALAADEGAGICAAVDMQLPARFLWAAYRAVLGEDEVPPASSFDKSRLLWRLLRMLPALCREESFSTLAKFLKADNDFRKHYQLACRLADLYDQYQVYRADWLADWARGIDRLKGPRGAVPLPAEQLWQAGLWRRLLDDVPAAERQGSRAALHQRFMRAVKAGGPRPGLLPRRVIVFGISSMPRQFLEALHGLAVYCQVLIFVHNPCRHYWADIIEDRELLPSAGFRHQRKDMPSDLPPELLHQHVNPLLAAWGKQGRDYIGLLSGYDRPDSYRHNFAEIDLFSNFCTTSENAGLLHQVQQGILDLSPLPDAERKTVIAADDNSITFQLACSRQREVEILHDWLLSIFDEQPELRPRDIIVMMPDVEVYAPHIEAVFTLAPDDPRYLPFSIADGSSQGGAQALTALSMLLRLPESRFTSGDILDLLEVPACRARFGLHAADLPQLEEWLAGAGVRWGLDAEQRQAFDLPLIFEENSWRFGLKRLLLGYAVGEGQAWHNIEPYAGVSGLEAELIGNLARLIEVLEHHWRILRRPAAPDEWGQRLRNLTADFFEFSLNEDIVFGQSLDDLLEQWLDDCQAAGFNHELPAAVVADMLLAALEQSSISQRFLAGMVNFCTLMPMRAIPFKVVGLLGMNDGDYPRYYPAPDFDLMAAASNYRPGDRSRREDDRYLFLEALLSARERLYISYIGRNVRDNSSRAPSVLVGQLRDYLAAGWRTADSDREADLLAGLTRLHPLQPFSRLYFSADNDLFTYAGEWSDIHTGSGPPPGAAGILPGAASPGVIGCRQLISLLKSPARVFYNYRLGVYFDELAAPVDDSEPFSLDALAVYSFSNELLSSALAAEPDDRDRVLTERAAALRRAGELPLAGFGELTAARLRQTARLILTNEEELMSQWPLAAGDREIRLSLLPRGREQQLEDWLSGLRQRDEKDTGPLARWEFSYKECGGKDKTGCCRRMLSLWVRHLTACAAGIELYSYLIGPDKNVELPPLPEARARQELTGLMEYWQLALRLPLPLSLKTALTWVISKGGAEKRLAAARKAYEGDSFNQGERDYDPCIRRSYADFEALMAGPEPGFTALAAAIYEPLARIVSNL